MIPVDSIDNLSFASTNHFSLIDTCIKGQNHAYAADLLLSLVEQSIYPDEQQIAQLHQYYKKIQKEFQQNLFEKFTFFLQSQMPSEEANSRLVECFQEYFLKTSLSPYDRIKINIYLHKISCEGLRGQLAGQLMQDFTKLEFFDSSSPFLGKEVLDTEKMVKSAQQALGEAAFCINSQLSELINKEWADPYPLPQEHSSVYFGTKPHLNLQQFKKYFKAQFEERFFGSLRVINPEQVRSFQHEVFQKFRGQFIDPLLSLPLTILNRHEINTEWIVFGSLSREELTPETPFEAVIALRKNFQLREHAELIKKVSNLIGVQILAVREHNIEATVLGQIEQKSSFLSYLPCCKILQKVNESLFATSMPLADLDQMLILRKKKVSIEHNIIWAETEKNIKLEISAKLENILKKPEKRPFQPKTGFKYYR